MNRPEHDPLDEVYDAIDRLETEAHAMHDAGQIAQRTLAALSEIRQFLEEAQERVESEKS